MRKLFLIPVLLCFLSVPAAFAATGRSTTDTSDGALISSALLADPMDSHEASRKLRSAKERAKREAGTDASKPAAPKVAVPPQLESIAACESGGNPSAVSSSGAYRGKYQFSVQTWQAVGGSGDPAAAPEAEQDRRAAMLYARSGAGQWPVCGS